MTAPRIHNWNHGLVPGLRTDVRLFRDGSRSNKPRIFGDPQVGIWIARLDASPSGKGWSERGTLTNPFFVSQSRGSRKDFYQVVHDGRKLQTGGRQEVLDSSFDPLRRPFFKYTHVAIPLGLLATVSLLGGPSGNQVECLRRGRLIMRAPKMAPLDVVIEEFAVTAILQGGRLLTDQIQPLPFRESDRLLKRGRFFSLPVRYLMLHHTMMADGQRVVVVRPEFNASLFDAALYIGTPGQMKCLAQTASTVTGAGGVEFDTDDGQFRFGPRSATLTPLQPSNPYNVDRPYVLGKPIRLKHLPIGPVTDVLFDPQSGPTPS